jgi:cytochrome c-type biogenesis protein CcmE
MWSNKRRVQVLIGSLVILLSLGYLVLGGLRDTMVYFVTPTELQAQGAQAVGKAVRLGGMVVPGSLSLVPETLQLRFAVADADTTMAVRHQGNPPDLFAEGRGVVLEGHVLSDGTFQAETIFAKHSEEYRPPTEAEAATWRQFQRRATSTAQEKP